MIRIFYFAFSDSKFKIYADYLSIVAYFVSASFLYEISSSFMEDSLFFCAAIFASFSSIIVSCFYSFFSCFSIIFSCFSIILSCFFIIFLRFSTSLFKEITCFSAMDSWLLGASTSIPSIFVVCILFSSCCLSLSLRSSGFGQLM